MCRRDKSQKSDEGRRFQGVAGLLDHKMSSNRDEGQSHYCNIGATLSGFSSYFLILWEQLKKKATVKFLSLELALINVAGRIKVFCYIFSSR